VNKLSSLILELQKESIDSSVPILNLLRKALIVATKLKLQDFKQWIESEMNGYENRQNTPKYRSVHGEIKYLNPFHGWQPIIFDISTESLHIIPLYQPVSELEKLINDPSNDYVISRYGEEKEKMIMNLFKLDVLPTLHITKANIYRILEAIRDTILQWSLELEEIGILGEGMTFSPQEKNSALQHKYETNNYITMHNQQFNAPVGAVQNGDYNTANVSQTVSSNNIEILQMIAELRQQINKLNQENQDIATDALDTLQSEVTNPTKTTKLKSALFTLWGTSQGVASFVNAVTAIADRFGVRFHN